MENQSNQQTVTEAMPPTGGPSILMHSTDAPADGNSLPDAAEEMAKRINNLPAAYNITDARIGELRTAFTGLTAFNEDGAPVPAKYQEVTAAISVLRGLRGDADSTKENLNADALTWQRAVNAEHKRIKAELEKIEAPLKEEKKRYDDVKTSEKAEKERLENEQYNSRLHRLMSAGMAYVGSIYTDGKDLQIEPSQIKTLSDADFGFFAETAEATWQQAQKDKAAELERQKAEKARLDAENEKLEKAQKELADAQLAVKAQQAALDKQKAEAEAAEAKRVADAEKKRLEDAAAESKRVADAAQARYAARFGQLAALGMQALREGGKIKAVVYGEAIVSADAIEHLSDLEWVALMEKVIPQVVQIKADESEAKRVKDEQDRKDAAEKERLAAMKAQQEKADADAAEKARLDAEKAAADARRPDVEKAREWVRDMANNATSFPDVVDEIVKTTLENYVTVFNTLNQEALNALAGM